VKQTTNKLEGTKIVMFVERVQKQPPFHQF